jgi:hypothetical protein
MYKNRDEKCIMVVFSVRLEPFAAYLHQALNFPIILTVLCFFAIVNKTILEPINFRDKNDPQSSRY